MINYFFKSQYWLSKKFDNFLPLKFTLDGNWDFSNNIAPKYLKKNIILYDIGGGKSPFLQVQKKEELNIEVIGLDIDNSELNDSPEGAYDIKVCCDITKYKGQNNADLVICQALLEHVPSVESAFISISSILKHSGIALIFVPSRNAIFAKLNILLPQNAKKAILFFIFPQKIFKQGFPAYYDRCTPSEFKKLGEKYGLRLIDEKYYFVSSYFSFFFPFYFFWRLWTLLFYLFSREQAAETFTLVFRKE